MVFTAFLFGSCHKKEQAGKFAFCALRQDIWQNGPLGKTGFLYLCVADRWQSRAICELRWPSKNKEQAHMHKILPLLL